MKSGAYALFLVIAIVVLSKIFSHEETTSAPVVSALEKPPATTFVKPKKTEEQKIEKLHSIGESVTIGNVVLKVDAVKIEKVKLKNLQGIRFYSRNDFLVIYLTLKNISDTVKSDYISWNAQFPSRTAGFASVEDNFGNFYKRIEMRFDSIVTDHTEGDSLYPGKSLTDVLVFEPPTENFERLKISFPLKNIDGHEGEIVFKGTKKTDE